MFGSRLATQPTSSDFQAVPFRLDDLYPMVEGSAETVRKQHVLHLHR